MEKHELFLDDAVKKVMLDCMQSLSLIPEKNMIEHLRTPPKFTVVRVNTVACSEKQDLKEMISSSLKAQYLIKGIMYPSIEFHPHLNDALIVKASYTQPSVEAIFPKVIVGLQCGLSVLRGSNVYAPGVTGMPHGLTVGEKVSVYADIKGICKRGWIQEFKGPSAFVGNGLLAQSRQDLFTVSTPCGIAIIMVEPLYDAPSIGDILSDDAKTTGLQRGFLQNLPSLLCGHALAPLPEHTILDMCSAPGGKATHIASLLNGKGNVIALDKSVAKIKQIEENASKLGLKNIRPYVFDSVKAVKRTEEGIFHESCGPVTTPPFLPGSFDRILLDAPCSGLGQRPQLYIPVRLKELESFPRIQRKLFATAVELLKDGGRMVYSTCTYTRQENEDVISWALQKFPFMRVIPPPVKQLGQPGLLVEGLTDEQCKLMQRFGLPATGSQSLDENTDTIGFFFCCLEKVQQ